MDDRFSYYATDVATAEREREHREYLRRQQKRSHSLGYSSLPSSSPGDCARLAVSCIIAGFAGWGIGYAVDRLFRPKPAPVYWTPEPARIAAPEASAPAGTRRSCDHPFPVQQHLRTLPQGKQPSAWKLATAEANGFTLGSRQTWVATYVKCTPDDNS